MKVILNKKPKPAKKEQEADPVLISNRKARHDYFVLESFEAGIALAGTEVKSLRAKLGNLNDAFAHFEGPELFLYGLHITPYGFGNIHNHDPLRVRKLLMHKRELLRLKGLVLQKGHTLIPLTLYLKRGRVKVSLGLCKGKVQHDKREDIKRRDADREARQMMKNQR